MTARLCQFLASQPLLPLHVALLRLVSRCHLIKLIAGSAGLELATMLLAFFHNTEGSRLTERVSWLDPCHVHSFSWGSKLVPSVDECRAKPGASPPWFDVCFPTNRADVLVSIHRSWLSIPPLDGQSHASTTRTPPTVAFRLRQLLSCCYCMTCGCLIPNKTTMTFFLEADSSQCALFSWNIVSLHRLVS